MILVKRVWIDELPNAVLVRLLLNNNMTMITMSRHCFPETIIIKVPWKMTQNLFQMMNYM